MEHERLRAFARIPSVANVCMTSGFNGIDELVYRLSQDGSRIGEPEFGCSAGDSEMGIDKFPSHRSIANKIDVRFRGSPVNEIQIRVNVPASIEVRANSSFRKDFSQGSAPDDFSAAISMLQHICSITISP